jgi:pSer/pThr/pTyr-binding forkhead associated (FHA) protein
MARLIVMAGESGPPEQSVDLGSAGVTIGREAGNDLVLAQEPKASRKHLQVAKGASGGWEVVDLESKNGTRVNGTDVKRRTLRPGDTIEVGKTKIRFEDETAAAAKDDLSCLLEYTAGDRKGDQVRLDRPRTTFGRRENNTVVLTDKMTSSHHCEIVRDLNGYVIRDLGSTNGTLVNGSPVTETALTHGARVRIGNSRFVFKDPAMAHIEVELAAIEEDDAGWGMMAELDLAKSKGGAGGILAAVALLAVVGALAYVYTQKTTRDATAAVADTNLVSDGRFDAADVLLWSVDEGSPATVERSGAGGRGVLVVANEGQGDVLGVARYGEDLDIASQPHLVTASIRKEGDGPADVAVQWVRRGNAKSGASGLTHVTVVGAAAPGGGVTNVRAVVQKPRWAEHGRLVVRVGPKTTARVDDVVMKPEGAETPMPHVRAGDVDVQARRDGAVDFVRNVSVLFAGAAPWARMPGGRVLGGPGAIDVEGEPTGGDKIEVRGTLRDPKGEEGTASFRVSWSATNDGALASVSVDGAEAVGLSADFPRAQVDTGVRVIAASGGKSYPAADLPAVEAVTKVLAGEPMVLLTLAGGGGRLEPRPSADPGFVRLLLWQSGAAAEFPFVLAFGGLEQEANRRLSSALARLESATGPAIVELRRVAEEFAFLQGVRDKALQAAAKREQKAFEDSNALADALKRHRIYGSKESLEEAERQAEALLRQFPPSDGGGGREPSTLEAGIHDSAKSVAAARRTYEVRRAAPEVRRLSRLAEMLEAEEGFEAVAAAYWDAVARRFGDLEGAADGPEAEEVAKRVKEARERLKALLAKPEVAAAFPTVPRK